MRLIYRCSCHLIDRSNALVQATEIDWIDTQPLLDHTQDFNPQVSLKSLHQDNLASRSIFLIDLQS